MSVTGVITKDGVELGRVSHHVHPSGLDSLVVGLRAAQGEGWLVLRSTEMETSKLSTYRRRRSPKETKGLLRISSS